MEKKNKILIMVMVLLMIALCIKSFVIDTYHTTVESELIFLNKVENIMNEKYTNWLFKSHLITAKVVKISAMNEREKTVKDKDGHLITVTGVYKAKIRKYILGVLPFSEERILDVNLDDPVR